MSDSNDDASSIIGGLITLGLAILVSKSNSNNKEHLNSATLYLTLFISA